MTDIDTTSEQSAGSNGADAAKASRPKPSKVLPTDRIRFDKQLDILRAFAAVSGHERKPVTLKEAGGVVDMADSTIAQITPFFADLGLIVREKKSENKGFIPSNEAIAYQKAYEWDKVNAAKKLAPLFSGAWFAESLMPKLKFRQVNEKEAINDLAEIAGVGPDKEFSLRFILDYLVVVGVIERDAAGLLRATSGSSEQAPPPVNVSATPVVVPAPVAPAPTGVKQHQLWLLEILNAYPELSEGDQDAILKLIKTIKGGKTNASPAANE
jgi:hypothetical protein